MNYEIVIQPEALQMLAEISDRRVQEIIRDRIYALRTGPEKQGKPLGGEFSGYRSVRAVGQRYRIIYRVMRHQVIVSVVAVGLRKEGARDDIYVLAKKLLRYRLL